MTVIICNREAMAADSMYLLDSRPGSCEKIHRLSDGSLLGIAGILEHFQEAKNWAEAWIKGEEYSPTFNGKEYDSVLVLLRRDGRIFSADTDVKVWVEDSWEVKTIGSGGALALGAYAAGASLIESVDIAIRHDNGCGGYIVMMDLNPGPVA